MEHAGEPCCQSSGIKIYKIKFSNSVGACTEVEKFRKTAGSFALIHGSITHSSMEGSEGRDYSCSLFEHLSGLASKAIKEIMRNSKIKMTLFSMDTSF